MPETNQPFTLSDEARKQMVQAIGLGVKASAAYRTAADTFRAEGVTSTMLEEDAKVKAYVLENVVLASFSAADRSIHARPTASLGDAERVTKRYVQDEARKRYRTIVRYVREAEKAEEMDDDTRATRAATTFEARLRNKLEAMIEAIRKRENLSFDVPKAVGYLKATIEVINRG